MSRMALELNRIHAGTFEAMVPHGMGRLLPMLPVFALAALGCGALGCGSKTATVTGPLSMDADFSVCAGTPGVHYAAGISVLSASGAYRAAIEAASTDQGSGAPVPTAAIGYDTFTVTVVSVTAGADAGSPPPDGLTMTTPAIPASVPADPFMPQHGHGAATVPTITPQGGGQFSVAAIDFFMGGYWQLYLDLTPQAGIADRVTFEICIPDD